MLGVGGMGAVYRARDTRLGRDVAIKTLLDSFTSDADRIARFEREAKVLASINHPNIASLYGVEELDGHLFLVMELVEGETLADRLRRGPLPVEDALDVALPIAQALEAAHEKHIVHRDLKPANVRVRDDGSVKVLDFGLAKTLEPAPVEADAAQSPTITSPALTAMGVILGTAAYMSPEQAKGHAADKRSDVWAFGCLLYEMLTGRRAFQADDVTDTLAAVLRAEPDWTALPDSLSPAIQALVRKCLEKDRRQRIADASTLVFVIRELRDGPSSRAPVKTPARPRWRHVAPLLVSVFVTGALTSAAWWIVRSSPVLPTTKFAVALVEGQRFMNVSRQVAISPDGRQIAYCADDGLYVRAMSDLVARPILGTQPPLTTPVFSPDGSSIAFASGRTLKRIQVEGGTPATVATLAAPLRGMSWHDDAILLGQAERGIWRVSANGGTPDQVIAVGKDEFAESPQLLPDGRSVLFTLASGVDNARWERARIVVQPIGSAERTTLIDGGADGRYLPTGHVVFARGGVLFAVPYDPRRSGVTGSPVPVVQGVRRSPFAVTGAAQFSISATGSLVYIPGPSSTALASTDLALIDRKGGTHPLKLAQRFYEFPRVSHDGKRIAFGTDDLKEANIWIVDVDVASPPRQLTTAGRNRFPIWTRDGVWITFQSDRHGDNGIFRQRADGSGAAERLTTAGPGTTHVPEAWSPDSRSLLFAEVTGAIATSRIFRLQDRKIASSGITEPSILPSSQLSPDGKWVAYTSPDSSGVGRQGDTGRLTVFVEPFPGTGAKVRLGEGVFPVWSQDGRELTYLEPGGPAMFAVNVTTGPTLTFGKVETLSRAGILAPRGVVPGPRNFDLLPGGQFVGIVEAADTPPQLLVVLNWAEELKQRVPTH
jgi:serine/threonine-protein kinase